MADGSDPYWGRYNTAMAEAFVLFLDATLNLLHQCRITFLVSPQPKVTDRDTCPASGTLRHTPFMLSPGDTVTKEATRRREEG